MDLRKDSKGSILHSYSQLHKANTLIFHNLIKNSTIEFMFSLQCYVATTIALTLLDTENVTSFLGLVEQSFDIKIWLTWLIDKTELHNALPYVILADNNFNFLTTHVRFWFDANCKMFK